jgi:MGT family glycosyltransferase
LCALGRVLQCRGHAVTVFQLPDLRARVQREGLEFWPIGDGKAEAGELASSISQLGRMTGVSAVRFTIKCAAKLAALVLETAPNALKAAGIDVALIDQNDPAGAAVADYLELPYISVAAALPLNREPYIPPSFVPWPFRRSMWAFARNRVGYAGSDWLLTPITSVINEQRRKWGLTALHSPDDSFSKLAQLCTLPETFDFPRRQLPPVFHYLGPFLDNARVRVPFPWDRLDGRPLVYASFGTLQNRCPEHFRAIAKACAGLDAQLVLSSGGAEFAMDDLPGSAIVVSYAPQIELLHRARLFITHSGLNSVLESLNAAVPVVAIPITNDQPAVAARVRQSGAGEMLPLNRLSSHRLRSAIERVLASDHYRQNATRIQTDIRNSGGVQRAADIAEHVAKKSPAIIVNHWPLPQVPPDPSAPEKHRTTST